MVGISLLLSLSLWAFLWQEFLLFLKFWANQNEELFAKGRKISVWSHLRGDMCMGETIYVSPIALPVSVHHKFDSGTRAQLGLEQAQSTGT